MSSTDLLHVSASEGSPSNEEGTSPSASSPPVSHTTLRAALERVYRAAASKTGSHTWRMEALQNLAIRVQERINTGTITSEAEIEHEFRFVRARERDVVRRIRRQAAAIAKHRLDVARELGCEGEDDADS